jgi:RNA ligase
MRHIVATIDLAELQKRVDMKLISKQKHNDADMFIYNYTPACQFNRAWDDYTMMARGLILNEAGDVIARPFPKFFNYEQHLQDPRLGVLPLHERMVVSEKMDGSLGIAYQDKHGIWNIATRGSFTSDQAKHATKLMHEYAGGFTLIPNYTYLFEIIYPDNRIVVDYGDKDELVLLAVIDTATGKDVDNIAELAIQFPWNAAKTYDATDITELKKLERDNAEGFVVKFVPSGVRTKIKFDEYMRLHRILTQITARDIWEYLAITQQRKEHGDNAKIIGQNLHIHIPDVEKLLQTKDLFADMLANVPDEFYNFVDNTATGLNKQYKKESARIARLCKKLDGLTKKEIATKLKGSKDLSLAFNAVDGKSNNAVYWLRAYPDAIKPFKVDMDA